MAGSFNLGTIFTVLKLQDEFSSGVKAASVNADGSFGRIVAAQDAMARSLVNVNKLAKEFSGANIAQKADEMAGAVKRAGGAAALTEAEMAKVNRTVSQAIEKYQKLGQEAPAHLLKLQQETAKVEKSTGLLDGTVGKLAAGFALGSFVDRAVGGLFDLGKEAFDTAGKIVDLSKKTGLSTDAVQRYGFAASQSGSNLEKWSEVIFKAGLNIEKGTNDARVGIAGLGLEYDRIRAMAPEQQFDAIMRALAGIESPQQRNLLGVQALGEGYKDVAAAVDGYVEMIGQAPVASEAAIRASDEAADAIGRAWDSAKAIAINAIGGILLAWEDSKKVTEQVAKLPAAPTAPNAAVAAVNPFAMNFGAKAAMGFNPSLVTSTTEAEKQLMVTRSQLAGRTAEAATAAKSYADRLADAQREIGRLTPLERAQIDAALKLGVAIETAADGYHLGADALKIYASATKDSSKASVTAAQVRAFLRDEELADAARFTAAMEQQQKILDDANKAYVKDFIASVRTLEASEEAATRDRLALIQQEIARRREFTSVMVQQEDILADHNRQFVDDFIAGRKKMAEAEQAAAEQFARRVSDAAQIAAAVSGATDGALATFADFTAQGLDAFASFASGDIVGGITKTITMIGNLARELRPVGAKVNDLRDEFLESAGGAEELYAQLERIGRLDLWDPLMAGPANIEAIESAIRQTEDAIEDTEAAMSRFGLTFDDVGTVYERQTRSVDKLIADYKLLEKAGFSVAQMASGSADRLNALIASALQTGQKLPESLRPYLTELVRSGGLTDDLKRKILGLADPVPWQQMKADAEEFGLDVKNLGALFEQAQLDSQAGRIAEAMERFSKNGTDAGVIMSGFSDEISAMVQRALELGLTLPDTLKPWIDQMDKAGQLVDRNGDRLEGIGDLKYAEPVMSETDRIIAKFDELIEKLTGPGGVTDAMAGAASGFRMPDTSGGVGYPTAHRGAFVTAAGLHRYHSGTARIIPFPSLPTLANDEFPALLQTGEAVLNRRATAALGSAAIGELNGGGSLGGGVVVNQHNSFETTVNGATLTDEQIVGKVITGLERNANGSLTRLKRLVA